MLPDDNDDNVNYINIVFTYTVHGSKITKHTQFFLKYQNVVDTESIKCTNFYIFNCTYSRK